MPTFCASWLHFCRFRLILLISTAVDRLLFNLFAFFVVDLDHCCCVVVCTTVDWSFFTLIGLIRQFLIVYSDCIFLISSSLLGFDSCLLIIELAFLLLYTDFIDVFVGL